MLLTAPLPEIKSILDAKNSDPHHLLGLHEIEIDDKPALAIRCFLPGAKAVRLIDASGKKHDIPLIHQDGFFERVLKNRWKWFRYLLEAEFDTGCVSFSDPYSFPPVISDIDFHLFGEGTHYKIYDKLGAHFMRHDGVDGVLFAVWAPNAASVSVVGDFCVWDGRRLQMRLLKNGIWELFVPGLCVYDRYEFEVRTPDGRLLRKSDPYGSFHELRPSRSSLLFNLDGYNWNDSEWLSERASKTDNENLNRPVNIYEVHLGSWKKSDDCTRGEGRFLSYTELADQLIPYAAGMGYTHIELLPVEEHPYDGSWGYQVTGYYAPTSRYGNPHEFMQFVDRCHQAGLGVILDWVPAHFPKDAHGLARFDGSALYEHESAIQAEHPEWGTLIFNYGRSEVKNFLIANALFWLEKYHIDGLRVDAVASMLYLNYARKYGEWIPNKHGGAENLEAVEFLKHLNSVISKNHSGVFMIAEESTSWNGVSRPVEAGGLGFNLKWNMGWMNDVLSYAKISHLGRSYNHTKLTFGMMYAHTENFVLVLSHDEVVHGKKSLLDKMPGDLWQKFAGLRALLGYTFGHPGKKLLFMGAEFGQFIEWDEKRELDWFLLQYPHHAQMHAFTKDLNRLYLKENACWKKDFDTSGFEWIDADDNQRSIVSFIRKTGNPDDTLIFIVNFTPVPYPAHRVGLPFKRDFKEILNSDDERYGGSGVINDGILIAEKKLSNHREYSVSVKLPPLGAVILKCI